MRRLRDIFLARRPGGEERRRYPREAVRLSVAIARFRNDPAEQHLAIDVSDGGMFVTPNLYGAVSETVLVVTGRPDRNGPQGSCVAAQIVAQRPEGTALVFTDPIRGQQLAHSLRRRARGGNDTAPSSDGTTSRSLS